MDQRHDQAEPDPITFMWACVLEVLKADGNPSPPEIVRHAAAAGLVLSESTFTGWFEVWAATPKRTVPQWKNFETFIKALSAEQDRDWRAVWDAAQQAKNEAARREREASPSPLEPDRARECDTALETPRGVDAVPSQAPAVAAEKGTGAGEDGTPGPRPGPRLHRRGVVVGSGIAAVLLALVGGAWLLGSSDPPAPEGPGVIVPSTRCDRYVVAADDLRWRDEYGTSTGNQLTRSQHVTVVSRHGPTRGRYWEVTADGGGTGWVDHTYLRPLCTD